MSQYDPSKVDLNPEEFAEHISTTPGAIILDVRAPEEYDSGHLPGALNININGFDFHEQISQLDPSKSYYVYCKAGGRSARACLMMHEEGFTDLHNLRGGIMAWHGDIEK